MVVASDLLRGDSCTLVFKFQFLTALLGFEANTFLRERHNTTSADARQSKSISRKGDIISIKLGDIISADARLLDVSVNCIYTASTWKEGEIEAAVIATGVHTFFGKVSHLVDSTKQQVKHVLTAIGNFCICTQFMTVNIVSELTICLYYPLEEFLLPCPQFYMLQWQSGLIAYLFRGLSRKE
ncbi:hypothetical protein V6N11_001942 [Hibiscus sabdariffa]|uniref:Uncharacterized protein n=1 Tax=Hibiscus sabdariffa TaxID=183260 RepID=A0ABR2QUB7_9ROSI